MGLSGSIRDMEAKPNGCLPSENPLGCKLGLGIALIGCKQISKLK